jgi:hypothetical protein
MKEFERIQMEGSKRSSKIDIATQGENVNPMAPSSQDVSERSCRTQRGGSGGAAVPQTHGQSTFTQASLQLEFLQATPGQQFVFRVPCAAFRAENNMHTPLTPALVDNLPSPRRKVPDRRHRGVPHCSQAGLREQGRLLQCLVHHPSVLPKANDVQRHSAIPPPNVLYL